jgi:soluble lytic murein transglycosylase
MWTGETARPTWLAALCVVCACGQQVDSPELARLRALGEDTVRLSDYSAFLTGKAHAEAKQYGDAESAFKEVVTHVPASPLRSQAAQQAAQAMIDGGKAEEAAGFIRDNRKIITEPEATALTAKAAAARGDLVAAAIAWQRVYYGWPDSTEGGEAGKELPRLAESLGPTMPPAQPSAFLGRSARLLNRGMLRPAQSELEAAVSRLAGSDHDVARVRLCEVDYFGRNSAAAYECLRGLEVEWPEADAERLYYLMQTARRLGRSVQMTAWTDALSKYPHSQWRLRALVAAGNEFQLQNRPATADRFFRACYAAFPSDRDGAYCHWKVAWNAYMARRADALELFRDHIVKYPDSEKTAAALYFLHSYGELRRRFPSSYYSVLARVASDPAGRKPLDWTPTEMSRVRIDRARLLAKAGFDDWSAGELRFAAAIDDRSQPHVLAFELAKLENARGMPHRGVRHIKAVYPGYLSLPFSFAPPEFWQAAFPLPYREAVETESREHTLDPYLVAALIRQESEFDPKAISPAMAYGLMQLLPSTAAEISRRAGVTEFTQDRLFEPDVNVRLGTYQLRSLINSFGGKIEPALAAYNSGKRRVNDWLSWYTYREPAEFVETIPITETRSYVQIIIRNADMYRRLYDNGKGAAE